MSDDVIDLSGPTPQDWGWVRWDWLCQMYEPADPHGAPLPIRCAVVACTTPPAVAARRPAGSSVPAFWQPYCSEHALARGIEVTATGLRWSRRYRAFQEARSVHR
jgi:hypothetical protein